MDVRAAVAFAAGKPLEVTTVKLDGPKAGEVLVEIKATGICHTDEFTLSGADPEGLFPPSSVMGRRRGGRGRRGVVVQEGRSCHSALHAGMPRMRVLPLAQDQSVPEDPHHPGRRNDARRHLALLARRQDAAPLHGHVDVRNFTVLPEIAVAKIRADAPFDKVCYIGCGVTTGIGAVINTARSSRAAICVVFGLGGIGLNVIQGLRLAGANMIVGVDLNPEREGWGERFGMTHFVNPKESGGDLVKHLVDLTRGGADYTFECVGNVELMRPALECCHKGWGESVDHRRGAGRAGNQDAAVPAGDRPGVEGHRLRRRARPHRRAQDRRLVHGGQDRDRPDDHPHDAARRINKAFDLMHAGESIRSVVVY